MNIKSRGGESLSELFDAEREAESLPEMLRQQVRQRPDVVAVVSKEGSLTYRQLVDGALSIGARLRQLGVSADDCVGLFVDSSLDMMLGTWGILFAGGAYLPLAPEYPDERLRHMIEDSGSTVVVTQSHLKTALKDIVLPGVRMVVLEELASGPLAVQDSYSVSETDLAYVIYTSGTTGKPKGVTIEHRSIVSQMQWLHDVYGIGEGKIVLRKTPMSFDAAQWELLAVACGSRVIMGSPGIHRDPDELIAAIVRHDVTTLQCVPTLLQALVEHPDVAYCKSLTQVFSGGEALSRRLALRCLKALPGRQLVNLYGPTECTVNTSAFTFTPDNRENAPNTVPIGRPVTDTRYFVLDDRQQPVRPGETGELYVSGMQLARGYLGRPELTEASFPFVSLSGETEAVRMYRTGDLVRVSEDDIFQYVGRADNQVKLRGFRIELDEIRLAIDNLDWIKGCGVLVSKDERTGAESLVACVELNPREAALMDQGDHDSHHQSKESRVQVKAQLSDLGIRDLSDEERDRLLDLPGAASFPEQRRQVFARKTYRFFDGGDVTLDDVLRLLDRPLPNGTSKGLDEITLEELGSLLRPFGQFRSIERLLPKYGYASPGALYATQLYLEVQNVAGLAAGFYYYHPRTHQFALIKPVMEAAAGTRAKLHFIGKKPAIQSVYKNNVIEVLEIETGHMLGLFDQTLPAYGLGVGTGTHTPTVKDYLECGEDHYYIGSFELVPLSHRKDYGPLDLYVQPHAGRIKGLASGQYRYVNGGFERISDDLVLKKHVIVINQHVYERSSLGMTVISRNPESWSRYIDLGRKLQNHQMNDLGFGFMSSGYSSKTGNDLLSAKRIATILANLNETSRPSYFFVGGRVSEEQMGSEGMKEDAVHMLGPAELIKKEIANFLPDYMIPHRIVIFDELPHTANGKVDLKALALSEKVVARSGDSAMIVAPTTKTEKSLADVWMGVMQWDTVSTRDNFFERDGNSLLAVLLVHEINRSLGLALPLQVIFEHATIEQLAQWIDGLGDELSISRLIPLEPHGPNRPIYCWPGLGGYPMNLRPLATGLELGRPFYGIQACGLNEDEEIYPAIEQMAAEDIKMIKRLQPDGPYTLWGYSFGARVAFEATFQLEQAGDKVDHLVLIAPGSPKLSEKIMNLAGSGAGYDNPAYLTTLFSVFSGRISGPALEECLNTCRDEKSFLSFITTRYPKIDPSVVHRIMALAHKTYEFTYDLMTKNVHAPVTIFKAQGDDYSFLEQRLEHLRTVPSVVDLTADHYGLLKGPGLAELVEEIQDQLNFVK